MKFEGRRVPLAGIFTLDLKSPDNHFAQEHWCPRTFAVEGRVGVRPGPARRLTGTPGQPMHLTGAPRNNITVTL